jgi:hypothetical protein
MIDCRSWPRSSSARVDVIFASGSSAPGLAAKAATSTISIVFQTGGDPVADGLVPSMNRPGANVTGVSRMTVLLDSKRLELLHEAVPKVNTFALLVNRDSPRTDFVIEQVQKAPPIGRVSSERGHLWSGGNDLRRDLRQGFPRQGHVRRKSRYLGRGNAGAQG